MNRMILVTSYQLPDLDGTACAIAYAEFLVRTGQPAFAAFFGEPHREAQFVRETFHLLPFKNAEETFDDEMGVVLVDASDLRGISDRIHPEQVIELIDHRSVNSAADFPVAQQQIELVGSCATLIAEKFFNEEKNITEQSTILLYSAIISNTVNFQANVTTDRDKKMAKWLLTKCSLPENYVHTMFAAKSQWEKPLQDVIADDFATFAFNKRTVGIAQLEILDVENFIKHNQEELAWILANLKKERVLEYIFLTAIDVENPSNTFLVIDDETKSILEQILSIEFADNIAVKTGIMMRKTLIPLLKEYFSK